MASSSVIKAIAVTAELCGRTLSDTAAKVFAGDLSAYPETAVLVALERCRREVRGALTLSDVIARIDDGRPGPEEAWAMLPHDEATTVVWTSEMAEAWGLVRELDPIAGRMAFREAYTRSTAQARHERRPPIWQASLGHDSDSREQVLRIAVEKGRLSAAHVAKLLPYRHPTPEAQKLLVSGLRGTRPPMPDNVRLFAKKSA